MSRRRFPCSVVIRTFNEGRCIDRLLQGIADQTVTDAEVIVVDSGSRDGTTDIATRAGAQVVHTPPDTFSFGRSLNLGVAAASADIIVVASGHVYPLHRRWLAELMVPFEDPRTALVYGRQRGDHSTRFSEHRVFERWFPSRSTADQPHPFCNNANAAIRRSVWKGIPYDETLTGLEDIDWARRAIQAGYRIAYAAEAAVIHVHNESYRRIYNRYRREAIALKHIFPEERFGLSDFLRLTLANFVADGSQAIRERTLWRNLLDIVGFRTMQFWGTYRGHARHRPVTSELRRRFYYPPERRGLPTRMGDQAAIDYSLDEHEQSNRAD